MVGVAGFEPATSCSQSRWTTKLSYTPSSKKGDAPAEVGGRSRDAPTDYLFIFQIVLTTRVELVVPGEYLSGFLLHGSR